MKSYDFLEAMNGLPEEYLTELSEWQQTNTPISGGKPEQEAVCAAPVTEGKTVKKNRQDISVKWLRPVTIGIFGTMAACFAFGLYFGIRSYRGGRDSLTTTPASEIEEQSSPDEKLTETDYAADFPKERELPESAVYNPDRKEYYNSNELIWNADTQHYELVHPADEERAENVRNADPDDYVVYKTGIEMYILTDKERPLGVTSDLFFPLIRYPSKVPDALYSAFSEYHCANAAYRAEHPDWMSLNHVPTDPEAEKKLLEDASAESQMCFELSISDGSYRGYAQHVMNGLLDLHMPELKGAFYQYMMYQKAVQATDEIRRRAALMPDGGLTAEDCAQLQEQYGYLIAPALKEAGKLDLLQINPELPCTDPDQIAVMAAWYARGYVDMSLLYLTTTNPTGSDTAPAETTQTTASAAPPSVTVPQNYPDASLSFSTAVLAAENRWVPCKEEWVENAAQTEAEWRSLIDGFRLEEVENYREVFDFDGGGFMLRLRDGSITITYELFSEGLYIRTIQDETGTQTAYFRDESGNETGLVWAIQKQFTIHNYQWSSPCLPVD